MNATLPLVNTLSLLLLLFGAPSAVAACLIAVGRRTAKPALVPPVLNQRWEPGQSGPHPKPVVGKISETKAPGPGLPGGGRHILLVDDDRHFAAGGRATLQQLGYRVTLMADANEALAVIRNAAEKIDCVITDLSMPGLSGFDLARICQRLVPGVPVILMSSQEGIIAAELLRACGVHAMLLKPFTRQTLAEAVERVLTGGKAGAEPD
jgi:CheY-like chemotaxis protein